jgi:hypothetical protein
MLELREYVEFLDYLLDFLVLYNFLGSAYLLLFNVFVVSYQYKYN